MSSDYVYTQEKQEREKKQDEQMPFKIYSARVEAEVTHMHLESSKPDRFSKSAFEPFEYYATLFRYIGYDEGMAVLPIRKGDADVIGLTNGDRVRLSLKAPML